MSRLLTAAELTGVTREDPPLTLEYLRQAMPMMYGRGRVAKVLAGDPPRSADWGCAGTYGPGDRYFLSARGDRTGIWIRITDRISGSAIAGGHVPWELAEAQLAPYKQDTLFD